jgi:signal transduction histidine kinase
VTHDIEGDATPMVFILRIDKAEVSLSIRDYGHGMPPQTLEQFQKTGGQTGIGLSGMRERVNELNGVMEIRSDSKGTIVRVAFQFPAKVSSRLTECSESTVCVSRGRAVKR